MKKLLIIILCLCMLFSLAACGKKQGPQGEPGKDGINGIDGKDGVTPTIEISDDGYWVINGEKTNVKATSDGGASTPENPQGLDFYLKDDGTYAVAVGNAKYLSKVVIPSTYLGKEVTDIAYYGFNECELLSEIVIPDSITSIGSSAFGNCPSLTSVYITDIAKWCGISFANYSSNPFYSAENLYLNGELVTNLVIPDSVTSIGSSVFYGCSSLTSVTIGNGVTSISSSAFSGCTSLTSIDVGLDNAYYKSIDGNLYTKNGKTIVKYATGKTDTTFSIPDGVTYMGVSAFEDCTNLTSITIPDSVASISNSAFYDCTSLASVTIPNSVTSIGDYAFAFCSSLTTINYRGTEAQWNAIDKDYDWNYGTGNYTIVYNYNG